MSKQIKISDVLHLAADKYLAYSELEWLYSEKLRFSCDAIRSAINELDANYDSRNYLHEVIKSGLFNMGLIVCSCREFAEFTPNFESVTPESQGARYAWLKFAAMIAEEQGV